MPIQLGIKALSENMFGQNVNDGQVQLVLGVPIEIEMFDWNNRPDDIMEVGQAMEVNLLPYSYYGVNLADLGVQNAISSWLFNYYAGAVGCTNSDGSINPDVIAH